MHPKTGGMGRILHTIISNSTFASNLRSPIPKPVITNRHNISPIEVKSGKSFTTTSLNKLRAKFAPMLAEAYVLHPGDVEVKDEVIYLPLYMAGLL